MYFYIVSRLFFVLKCRLFYFMIKGPILCWIGCFLCVQLEQVLPQNMFEWVKFTVVLSYSQAILFLTDLGMFWLQLCCFPQKCHVSRCIQILVLPSHWQEQDVSAICSPTTSAHCSKCDKADMPPCPGSQYGALVSRSRWPPWSNSDTFIALSASDSIHFFFSYSPESQHFCVWALSWSVRCFSLWQVGVSFSWNQNMSKVITNRLAWLHEESSQFSSFAQIMEAYAGHQFV